MTNTALSQTVPARKLSTQMCALLMIFSGDASLMDAVEPFVDLKLESIDWVGIHSLPMGSGHKAAVAFAYGVWTDEVLDGYNPFGLGLSMERPLQRACLQALALRWGHKG